MIEYYSMPGEWNKIKRQIRCLFNSQSKSVTVLTPTADQKIFMFYTERELDIRKIYTVGGDATDTVTWNLGWENSDGTGEINSTDFVYTADSITTITAFDDPVIPKNSYVFLNIVAVSGSPTSFGLTMYYN